MNAYNSRKNKQRKGQAALKPDSLRSQPSARTLKASDPKRRSSNKLG